MSRSCRASVEEKARPEKRREEKSINTPPPPQSGGAFCAALNSEEFQRAWSEWLAFQPQVRRGELTAAQQAVQLERLAAWGATAAVASIRRAMAEGSRTLRHPSHGRPAGGQALKPPALKKSTEEIAAETLRRRQEDERTAADAEPLAEFSRRRSEHNGPP